MAKIHNYLLPLFFLVSSLLSNAQDSTITSSLESSPYEFTSQKEIPFLLATGAIGLTTAIIQFNTDEKPLSEEYINSLNSNDINSFDRRAVDNYSLSAKTRSDVLLYGTALMPATFLLKEEMRNDIIPLALMSMEVFIINYGVTHITKYAVQRTRPYVYNSSLDSETRSDPEGKLSFFSGHASHAAAISFMTAKVWIDYTPNMKAWQKVCIWTAAVTYPAVTGYLRVRAGKHFPTDVITGYGVGAIIGYLVPHLHKRRSNLSIGGFQFQDAKGMSFTYRF